MSGLPYRPPYFNKRESSTCWRRFANSLFVNNWDCVLDYVESAEEWVLKGWVDQAGQMCSIQNYLSGRSVLIAMFAAVRFQLQASVMTKVKVLASLPTDRSNVIRIRRGQVIRRLCPGQKSARYFEEGPTKTSNTETSRGDPRVDR